MADDTTATAPADDAAAPAAAGVLPPDPAAMADAGLPAPAAPSGVLPPATGEFAPQSGFVTPQAPDLSSYAGGQFAKDFNEGASGATPFAVTPALEQVLTDNPSKGIWGGIRQVGAEFNKAITMPVLSRVDSFFRVVGGLSHALAPATGGLSEYPGVELGGMAPEVGAAITGAKTTVEAPVAAGSAALDAAAEVPVGLSIKNTGIDRVAASRALAKAIAHDNAGNTAQALEWRGKLADIVGLPVDDVNAAIPAGVNRTDAARALANIIAHQNVGNVAKANAAREQLSGITGLTPEAPETHSVPVEPLKPSAATPQIAKETGAGPYSAPATPQVPKAGEEMAQVVTPGATFSADEQGAAVSPPSASSRDYANNPKVGNIRTDILENSADFVPYIKRVSDENSDFAGPRNGGMPVQHLQNIADQFGIDVRDAQFRNVGQTFTNDRELATAGMAWRQAADNVVDKAGAIKGPDDVAGLIDFENGLLRLTPAQEALSGYFAEWGRSGQAIQGVYGGKFHTFSDEAAPAAPVTGIASGASEHPVPTEAGEGATPLTPLVPEQAVAGEAKPEFALAPEKQPAGEKPFKLTAEKATQAKPRPNVQGTTLRPGDPGYRIAPRLEDFTASVKDEKTLSEWLARAHGETLDDLRGMAKQVRTLRDRKQLNLFLNNRRPPPSKLLSLPTRWDKFMYLAKNAWLSGMFSHAGYAASLIGFAGLHEGLLVPAVGGLIGKARDALGVTLDGSRAFSGEAAARFHGMLAAVPAALKSAAYDAIYKNVRPPLPGEGVARRGFTGGFTSPFGLHLDPQTGKFVQSTAGKIIGATIGAPMRVIGGIGQFFRDIGFHGTQAQLAYRRTLEAGHEPLTQAFRDTYKANVLHPSDADLAAARESADYGHFLAPLGPKMEATKRWMKQTKFLQPIIPFVNVPYNIARAARDNSPAAWMAKDTRDALMGRKGGAAADQAWARMLIGSSVVTYLAYQTLMDNVTDSGPTDTDMHRDWLRTHMPNAIRLGDHWVSARRFGPIGDLMVATAGLTNTAKYGVYAARDALAGNDASALAGQKPIPEAELEEAAGRFTHDAASLITSNLGMEGLSNVVEAMNDPNRKGWDYVTSFGTGLTPFSVGLSQAASAADPYARNLHGLVGALKSKVPGYAWGYGRESLPYSFDSLGRALPNPGYAGNGYLGIEHAIPATPNPVDVELHALNLHVAPLRRDINGLNMNDDQWARYQAYAGTLTQRSLAQLVAQPGWYQLPAMVRERMFANAITESRKLAAIPTASDPHFIMTGIRNKLETLLGAPGHGAPEWLNLGRPTYQGQ